MRRICAIAIAFLGSAAAAAGVPDDAGIAALLPGRWTTSVTGGSSTGPDGTIRYDPAGTFKAEGTAELGGGQKAEVRVEGTWAVKGGCILHRVSKSSHPGLAPVGGEVKEHVLAIDDEAMRVRRGVGRERERARVKE